MGSTAGITEYRDDPGRYKTSHPPPPPCAHGRGRKGRRMKLASSAAAGTPPAHVGRGGVGPASHGLLALWLLIQLELPSTATTVQARSGLLRKGEGGLDGADAG